MTSRHRRRAVTAWLVPVFGALLIAAAIALHVHDAGEDSRFVLALLTLGGGFVARAERAYHVTRIAMDAQKEERP